MAKKKEHPWSKDALLAKSQLFFEQMLKHTRDEWQYAHWSTLALELLARAALAKVSPALLAESNSWEHVYYALGFPQKTRRYVPHSIAISSVFTRLGIVVDGITPDMVDFGMLHMNRRNEELHTGTAVFDALSNSKWQPEFFETCKALIWSMGKDLAFLIDSPAAMAAEEMIAAYRDDSAKAVNKAIIEHRTKWEAIDKDEKVTLQTQTTIWATRLEGHRVECPSCGCTALVHGSPLAGPIRKLDDDDYIVEKQEYLPSRFECIGCGLRISSFAQLNACGLGDAFTSTVTYSAAELYGTRDNYDEYEEDNNER